MKKGSRTTVAAGYLDTIRSAVIARLNEQYFGYSPLAIVKGARLVNGGVYKQINDWCFNQFDHRPGQGTISSWIETAKDIARANNAQAVEDAKRTTRNKQTKRATSTKTRVAPRVTYREAVKKAAEANMALTYLQQMEVRHADERRTLLTRLGVDIIA